MEVEVDFEGLKECFEGLRDPRVIGRTAHNLTDILFLTLCAVLCGMDDWESIEEWGKERQEWLRQYVEVRNGIPSHDTISRVFAALDSATFQTCFIRWMGTLCPNLDGQIVAARSAISNSPGYFFLIIRYSRRSGASAYNGPHSNLDYRTPANNGLIFRDALLSIGHVTLAADTPVDRACSDAPSHADQRACLESLFTQADLHLASVEKDALNRIRAWDEEQNYRNRSRQQFLDSIQTFRKYRTSQCRFLHSLAAGGNGATDMMLSCSIELSNQRIAQLVEYMHGLQPR
jgi:uncharacterized protein YecT (DUF1311 family)